MNHWIISMPREDMLHCIDIRTYGKNRKWVLGRVKPGDAVACVASREWKILALGEFTSELFLDDEPVFKSEGVFPFRVNFNAKLLPAQKQIEIKPIILEFSIVRSPSYWGAYFKASPTQITKGDWDMLNEAVFSSAGGSK